MGSGKGKTRRVQVALAAKQTVPEIIRTPASSLSKAEGAVCRKLTFGAEGYMLDSFNDVLSKRTITTGRVWRTFSGSGKLAAWALLIDDPRGDYFELDVYVRESERGKGLGKRLAGEAVRSTRKPIWVEATDWPAYQLYKKVVRRHKHVSFRNGDSPYNYPQIREDEIFRAVECACFSVADGDGTTNVNLDKIDIAEKGMVVDSLEEVKEDYPIDYRVSKKGGYFRFTVFTAAP